MATIKKIVFDKDTHGHYGILGEPVESTEYVIGDVYRFIYSDRVIYGVVVVNSKKSGCYPFFMGLAGYDIRKQHKEITDIELVIPAQYMTEDLLKHFGGTSYFSFSEEEVKELTLDEIRQYVPFEFVLKESK